MLSVAPVATQTVGILDERVFQKTAQTGGRGEEEATGNRKRARPAPKMPVRQRLATLVSYD